MNYEQYKIQDLQEFCRTRGLSVTYRLKGDLIRRLENADGNEYKDEMFEETNSNGGNSANSNDTNYNGKNSANSNKGFPEKCHKKPLTLRGSFPWRNQFRRLEAFWKAILIPYQR